MEKVIFEVETITPMFLAGNDQFLGEVRNRENDEPSKAWHIRKELRPSSIRGLLRYWQRALVGGVVSPLQEVKRCEEDIFGATDKSSAVNVRFLEHPLSPQTDLNIWDHRTHRPGENYLLWSMDKSGTDDFKAARYYYPAQKNFPLLFSVKGSGKEAQEKLNRAVAAFWLLTNLGGVGSRSRRCAGSLTASIKKDGNTYELPDELASLFNPVDNVEALQKQLADGIKIARKQYGLEGKAELAAQQFDTLTKNACSIQVFRAHQTARRQVNEAMDDIGKSLRDYRKSIKPVEERKIFGLPLNGDNIPLQLKDGRRASPLLLRLSQLQNGEYVGVAVLFQTLDGDKNQPDYSHIMRFVNTFPHIWKVQL